MYDKIISITEMCVVLLMGGIMMHRDYQLVWSDEFNKDGCWMNQYGIMNRVMLVMRSYNGINLTTLGVGVGCLVIEARSEKRKIRLYKQVVMIGATSREYIGCTSLYNNIWKERILYWTF